MGLSAGAILGIMLIFHWDERYQEEHEGEQSLVACLVAGAVMMVGVLGTCMVVFQ